MDSVLAEKGEGMMIKDPDSKYERKRSGFLLKCKKFDDAEATIISLEKGTGRLSKLMGAIRVKSDQGIEFKIGSGFDDA
jgi:DNA ligase-1